MDASVFALNSHSTSKAQNVLSVTDPGRDVNVRSQREAEKCKGQSLKGGVSSFLSSVG